MPCSLEGGGSRTHDGQASSRLQCLRFSHMDPNIGVRLDELFDQRQQIRSLARDPGFERALLPQQGTRRLEQRRQSCLYLLTATSRQQCQNRCSTGVLQRLRFARRFQRIEHRIPDMTDSRVMGPVYLFLEG